MSKRIFFFASAIVVLVLLIGVIFIFDDWLERVTILVFLAAMLWFSYSLSIRKTTRTTQTSRYVILSSTVLVLSILRGPELLQFLIDLLSKYFPFFAGRSIAGFSETTTITLTLIVLTSHIIYFELSSSSANKPSLFGIQSKRPRTSRKQKRSKLENNIKSRRRLFTRQASIVPRAILNNSNTAVNSIDLQNSFRSAFESHTVNAFIKRHYSGLRTSGREKSVHRRTKPTKSALVSMDFHLQSGFIAPFYNNTPSPETPVDSVLDEHRRHPTFDNIVERLELSINTFKNDRRNDVFIVSGTIGCGKSTLVSNLVYRTENKLVGQAQKRRPSSLPIECAFVDLENLESPSNSDLDDFMDNKLDRLITQQIASQTNFKGTSLYDIPEQTVGRKFLLIFDNLDVAYHNFCTRAFISTQDLDETSRINLYHPLVYRLISEFTQGRYCEISATVIFAIRNDTADCFLTTKRIDDGGRNIVQDIAGIYTIKQPDTEIFLDILIRRLELAKSACVSKGAKNIFEKRIQRLKATNPDFSEILHLSVQGLRHAIRELSELSIAIENDHLFERLFCNDRFLRLFFYVSGREHYSQMNTGITNIFLVNNDYRKANNPKARDGKPLFGKKYLAPHPQTYWLKYFVLLAIHYTATDKQKILQLFATDGNYEKKLVELVLFSLSETQHGRLIVPSIILGDEAEAINVGLTTSDRAVPLIEKDYFWDFDYLSLVVEDTWLEIPNIHKHTFENPPGFNFLAATTQTAFERQFFDYLQKKTVTVFTFLTVLEATYHEERTVRKDLFDCLREQGVPLPNFNHIRRKCIRQLESNVALLPSQQRKEILKTARKMNARLRRLLKHYRTRRQLRECFR